MDVNIITFHRNYNYGAMLQAYALQGFITPLGYDAGVYDYVRPESKAVGSKQRLISFLSRLNKRDCQIREANYMDFCQSYVIRTMYWARQTRPKRISIDSVHSLIFQKRLVLRKLQMQCAWQLFWRI